MSTIVGIDPGFKGGIAVIVAGELVAVEVMPVIGTGHRQIDGPEIRSVLRNYPAVDLVVLEKVGVHPGEGIVSAFRFGEGVGIIKGVVAALGIPLVNPTPQAWKKVVLAGTAKDKDAAIQHVRSRWPDVRLVPPRCRVPHDGIADSVCLAEFGLLTLRA